MFFAIIFSCFTQFGDSSYGWNFDKIRGSASLTQHSNVGKGNIISSSREKTNISNCFSSPYFD